MKFTYRLIKTDYFCIDLAVCECGAESSSKLYVSYGDIFKCPGCGKVITFTTGSDDEELSWYIQSGQ